VAVSFTLLIGAGLMIRSFLKMQQVNPGFNPEHLLAMRLSVNYWHYKDDQLAVLSHNILRRVNDIGAVQSAALASNFPFNPGRIVAGPTNESFEIEGRHLAKGEAAPLLDLIMVSPEYFRTLRQPLLKGRTFTYQDNQKHARCGDYQSDHGAASLARRGPYRQTPYFRSRQELDYDRRHRGRYDRIWAEPTGPRRVVRSYRSSGLFG
jgi:hypothetical protein